MTARYAAYCRLTGGLDPAATLARDGAAYPGGRMAGFVAWCAERWREWGAGPDVGFDEWLAGLEPSEVA